MPDGTTSTQAELSFEALLEVLRERGVQLALDGDRLRASAPAGVLDANLQQVIRRWKPQLLELLRARTAATGIVSVGAQDVRLSPVQERIWLAHELDPDSSAYNLTLTVAIDGTLDVPRLERVLTNLVERHESLRTLVADGPEGALLRTVPAPSQVMAFQILRDGTASLQERVREQQLRPFDLRREIPFRAQLLRAGEVEHHLVLTMHHVAADGVSLQQLCSEIEASYAGRELPPLACTYRDYASWQRARWSPVAVEERLDYWREALRDAPRVLELPTDRPRSRIQTFTGAWLHRTLAPADARTLRVLAAEERSSLFMVLLAAYAAALHGQSGQRDLLIGTPLHGRDRPELGSMVGMFVNQLPLRMRVPRDVSLRELVRSARERVLGTMTDMELPFGTLLDGLAVAHDPSRTPLFQALLNVVPSLDLRARDGSAGVHFRLPPTAEMLATFDAQAKFDLTLYASEREDTVGLTLVYNRDLYDQARMEALLDTVERLLTAPDGPDALVAQTLRPPAPGFVSPFLPSEPSPGDTVLARVRALAGKAPAASAVEDAHGCVLTRAELLARVERAARLIDALAPIDRPVGVLVPHDTAAAVAILGVLAAGRPYVPLDAAYPAERLRLMARDAQLGLVLTTAALRAEAEALLGDGSAIATLEQEPPAHAEPPPQPAPDDLAYLLYTSGSTGRPKAVKQSHRNLLVQAERYVDALGITASDRLALLASISFDASLMDLFGGLVRGACVRFIDPRTADLSLLPDEFIRAGLTTLHVTPTVFRTLARTAPDAAWPTVRAVALGGEPVRSDHVEYFDRAFSQRAVLLNLYGASEHSFSFGYFVPRSLRSSEVPIGAPLGDVEALLLDDAGEEDPVRGELVLRSAHGALGYWNAPEQEARAFLPDPQRPDGRLYRTGDLARRRPDGLLVCLGRVDNQLKVRGHRIEPAEIEAVLRTHPDVLDAGVHAPLAADSDRIVMACVVARDGSGLAPAALADWCSARLPPYMVPSAWAQLPSLPRTPSGKVDRRALPSADEWDTGARASLAPRNAEEETLLEIWRDALRQPVHSVLEDFFQQGGHSLSATQVVVRVRDVFGVELPLRRFFDHPTIAETAEWVREHRGNVSSMPPLQPRLVSDAPAPLSFSQERLWFLQQVDPSATAYNMTAASLLEGPLDVPRLEQAFCQVVLRQEALRTSLVQEHGRAAQVVAPAPNHEFRVDDAADGPEAERLGRAVAAAIHFLDRPYDLARDPLFRVIVVRLAAERHLLGIGTHHTVSDMWSYGVLARDLRAAYDQRPLQPLPISYRDYAVWQREWLQGDTLEQQVRYWRDQLAGLPTLELPTDYSRPPFFSFAGDRIERELPPELRERIRAFSAEQRVTPFMTLLAAFKVLLAAHSRQHDIAVGVPIAGRVAEGTQPLVGTFVNTLVHRNEVRAGATFRELLGHVREAALDAFAHQDAPFELLVRELQPPRDPSRTPLVQVLFNVANVPVGDIAFDGVRLTPVSLARRAAQFDLAINVGLNDLQSDVHLTYNTSLFSHATVEHIIQHYIEILARCVATPDRRVGELFEPASAGRRLLLEDWNDTQRDYPSAASVPALFAVAALRTPDAIAVDSPTGSFTYAGLLDAAQRVTAALQAAGVRPGDRVAILMERSRELLAALLGIMGAGAAYVPVDPTYPEARVRYVLEDAGARLLVTHRGLERRLSLETPTLDLDRWTPPEPAPFVATRPGQAAYAIYTSGSTGKPKGVEIPHGAMVNFLLSMQERPGITAADRLLAVTTISFDIAVLELYLPLISGARVVIASEDDALDGRRLAQLLDDREITLMQATPATWKLLVAGGWQGRPGLRVLCGGEPLSRALADEILARAAELWNMYGPTETTVWSTLERIPVEGPILIGRPIANTTVYVLGPELELLPIGVPGELWIGGAGVASGYVNRPDLTAERFIESPFRPGERLYRTGDQVRWRHDGRLEHMGRLDHQVKIRGFRIELGEVEAALLSHEAVRDAVVAARDDRLVGYVVYEPGTSASASELRSWVGGTLPPYMVPSIVVPMDALPLTPNGKVDRKQLPDPVDHAPEPAAWQPPEDPAARAVAEVWAELLGIDQVGLDDNFFEVGGHSLLAMEAVALIEERTGHRVAPRSLFFMSLGQLAASLPTSAREA